MKKLFLCLFLAHAALFLKAQEKQYKRCGTDEYLQQLMARDPGLQNRIAVAEARIARGMDEKLQARRRQGNHRINATVTIPVVVHILLPNPNMVTDADVLWQINNLNTDFAGQNADSVNAGPFAASFGHSNIQFCLAQQDPKGNPTNGIQRVVSSRSFTQDNFHLLKHASNCGADAWDTEKYLNIWVAESEDGTLGVATFPLSTDPSEQGVVIAVDGFGNNPAYVAPAFNQGRTLVHETGHFFFARHIWGDGGGCNSDFPVVSGLNGSWVDDTPTQGGPTSGCPTGIRPAGCGSPDPPGKMYQNYMDYTNDACYCMFTINQVLRMETALDIFRNSLINSDKCNPAVIVSNDASITQIINPAPPNACGQPATNTFCESNFSPRVLLKNYGLNPLSNVTVYAQVDNLPPVSTNWTGNLLQGETAAVDLTALSATPGNHTLTIYVSDPNAAVDGKTTNDTLTASFTMLPGLTAPITENFESPTFPPVGWRVRNDQASSLTWERTNDAGKTGSASARMRFFEYNSGTNHTDYLMSDPINVGGEDSVILSFYYAYSMYNMDHTYWDSLSIVVSTDCGATFTEIWKRYGENMATVPAPVSSYFIPSATDWAFIRLDLKPVIGNASKAIVAFRAVNRFGNNLYIDDINVQRIDRKSADATITGIISPFTHTCSRTFSPTVTLFNPGSDTIKTANIVLLLNDMPADTIPWSGSLAPGHSIDINGNDGITAPSAGEHSITAYADMPNGVIDGQPMNDTFRMRLVVHDKQPLPLQEGFEGAQFPPTGWSITASGSDFGWQPASGAASQESSSAWIRNFRFNSNGHRDDLYTPLLEVDEFDSVVVHFDVAHAIGLPATKPSDTLEVLLTKDCGKTFTTVYKKWGNNLQTTGTPPSFPPGDTTGFVPTAAQWRSEYLDLTPHLGKGNTFMLVFRSTSNQGNNIFLDNINLHSVILPPRLKDNGYMITPNPFGNTLLVRHVAPPVNLQGIVVTNAAGHIVYRRQFSGNASNYLQINLTGYASGLYYVKLVYSDKVITQKMIKL